MKRMEAFSFLAEESKILLYAGRLGLELGLIYDAFRIIRRVWNCNFFWTTSMDMLFWIFTAYRTFYIMHTRSNGTLRWFAVLGAVTVLLIYLRYCSRWLVGGGVFLLSWVKSCINRCKKLLTNSGKLIIIKLKEGLRKGG